MFAAVLALVGPGCIHIHTDGAGKTKSVEVETARAEEKASAKADGAVKQASAMVPAAAGFLASLPKLPGFGGAAPPVPAVQATQIGMAWQNRLAQLPDPARNGAAGVGLVGQMFLFGSGDKMPFAPANGKLTVELFDETPRPGVAPGSVRLGGWTFDKETLKRLVTVDDRFGMSYALFLPWPDYRPDIIRVKLTARYDPEQGHPLYASPSSLTIDTSAPGSAPTWTSATTTMPPAAPTGPATPAAPPANVSAPAAVATPAAPVAPAAAPAGLPPIAITVPTRR